MAADPKQDYSAQTVENTRNITTLTATVTKLATVVEMGEKQRESDRADWKEIAAGLKVLGDKFGSVSGVLERIAEVNGEVGKVRHDLKNTQHTVNTIEVVRDRQVEDGKKLADHDARINELEKWKDKTDGATGAVRLVVHVLWALFGATVTGLAGYLIHSYATRQ